MSQQENSALPLKNQHNPLVKIQDEKMFQVLLFLLLRLSSKKFIYKRLQGTQVYVLIELV